MKRHIIICVVENDPLSTAQTNFILACPVNYSSTEEFWAKQLIEKEENKDKIFEHIKEIVEQRFGNEIYTKVDFTTLRKCIEISSRIVVDFVDGSFFANGKTKDGIEGYFIAIPIVMKYIDLN